MEVTFENKTDSLRNMLKSIQINNQILFYGIEQGGAKKSNQVHIFYKKENTAIAKNGFKSLPSY